MAQESVEGIIREYLRAAAQAGFHIKKAVLFGSYARGHADEWSDIDLIIIAPEFDGLADRALVTKLWELRARTDSRIEPVPCGVLEWEKGSDRPIIEIARREGVVIAA